MKHGHKHKISALSKWRNFRQLAENTEFSGFSISCLWLNAHGIFVFLDISTKSRVSTFSSNRRTSYHDNQIPHWRKGPRPMSCSTRKVPHNPDGSEHFDNMMCSCRRYERRRRKHPTKMIPRITLKNETQGFAKNQGSRDFGRFGRRGLDNLSPYDRDKYLTVSYGSITGRFDFGDTDDYEPKISDFDNLVKEYTELVRLTRPAGSSGNKRRNRLVFISDRVFGANRAHPFLIGRKMSEKKIHDVIIVGSGPAGYTAASRRRFGYCCQLSRRDCCPTFQRF